jgi:predicted ABC-type ATPase
MSHEHPRIVILAGPNGAGKSTSAAKLLLGPLQVREFVNADTIAEGLSAFSQHDVAFAAGRIMLQRLHELADARVDFAFETTLATRSYARWLHQLQATGYRVQLVFLWLSSPDVAVARVADRVRGGGHHIVEDVIRRRYAAGLANLRSLYLPLADSWELIDNTRMNNPRVIAAGRTDRSTEIRMPEVWKQIIGAKDAR